MHARRVGTGNGVVSSCAIPLPFLSGTVFPYQLGPELGSAHAKEPRAFRQRRRVINRSATGAPSNACDIEIERRASPALGGNRTRDRKVYLSTLNCPGLCAEVAPCGGLVFRGGTCSVGIAVPWNRRRQGTANHRAQAVARLRRALSTAMPVLAYICR